MIKYELSGHIATITLDRPESLNAVSSADLAELGEMWLEFRSDDAARVAVLTGSGQRAFCAGTDLKDPLRDSSNFEEEFWRNVSHGYGATIEDGLPIWKPIIAAINGVCVGEGLVMSLAADIRICSDNATFSLPEVKIGSNTITGAAILPSIVGDGAAAYLALTGDTIDAAEALRINLVKSVHSQDALMGEAERIANMIANNSPLAVQAVKGIMRMAKKPQMESILTTGYALRHILRKGEDYHEGIAAFRERRVPQFQGK